MDSWLMLTGGQVIDGLGNAPVVAQSVLIKNDRIDAIGESASFDRVPRGDRLEVIDTTGKTVMPGLIDMHTHISFGEARTQEEQDLYSSVESRSLLAAWNAQKVLRAGVTSASAPGGSWNIGVAVRDAIKGGYVVGPRMTSAAQFISTSNGIANYYPSWVGAPKSSTGVIVDSRDAMVAEVRRQVKDGVDFVKIGDSVDGGFQAFSYDELAAMAAMAHQLGKKIAIHARGGSAVADAVRAEFDWIMHGDRMNEDDAAALADSGIPLCPTVTMVANFAQLGHVAGMPPARQERAGIMLERIAKALTMAHEAGATFLMGTDSGFAATPFGEWHARELELLCSLAGLSPLEAIKSATSNAAFAFDQEGTLGQISEGAVADVLIVDGDPLSDIRVLQDKERLTVIQGGAVVAFTPEAEDPDRRWSHDRAMTITRDLITQDAVRAYEEGVPVPDRPASPLYSTRDEAGEMVRQFDQLGREARLPE